MKPIWKIPGARIRRRGDSYQSDVTWEGQRYRKCFRQMEEAKEWALDSLMCLRVGQKPKVKSDDFGPKNFEELTDRAFEMLWADGQNQASTKVILKKLGEILPGNYKIIDEMEGDKVVRVLRGRGLSPRTINNYLNVLGKVLTFAHDRKWIRSRPKLRREKEKGAERRHFSAQERKAIVDFFQCTLEKPEYSRLFNFLCDTGLRMGEALGLTWGDCTLTDPASILVKKRKHRNSPIQTIPLTRKAHLILRHLNVYHDIDGGPFANLT